MGIIIALIIFGLIVTVHEFGHFICAKLSGIKVLEFSVGMGPKIVQKQFGETMYSLRALPVGGYCAMQDEDAESADPRGFRNAKLWKRAVVLFAGPFMNFILGFILVVGMVCMTKDGVITREVEGFYGAKTESGDISYYSRSCETGLKHGDKFVEVDGIHIFSYLDLSYIFQTTKTHYHDVTVIRDGQKVELEDVEFRDSRDNDYVDFGLVSDDKNFVTVIEGSSGLFMSMGHMVGMSLKQLSTGKVDKEEVSGPVGVVSSFSDATEKSEDKQDALFQLFYMSALISINVGIFNLLPIPGLDGGRLLFCLIELVRRKPVKPEHEGYVHLAGMVLLFGIMLFATYNDIIRLIKK
jgi:regulator of sigma E protease